MEKNGKKRFFGLAPILAILLAAGSLFAQEVEQLEDLLMDQNFLELMDREKEDHISITTTGFRAQAIADRDYNLGEGFRIQAFAGSNRAGAEKIARELMAVDVDSVYVFEDNDQLFKVQVGNYDQRGQADVMLDRVRKLGFKTAWVVKSEIHVPKPVEERQAIQEARVERARPVENLYYSVQVFATGDKSRAEQVRASFANEIDQPVEIQQQNSVWKVLVGQFPDKIAAETFLRQVRNQRFGDAWITQIIGSGT